MKLGMRMPTRALPASAMPSEATVTITKAKLCSALATWEIENRMRRTMSEQEALALSIDERAAGGADYLFSLLSGEA